MKFVRAVDLASSLLIALVGTNRFGKFQKMTACRQKTPEGTKLTLPLAHLLPHTHTNKSPGTLGTFEVLESFHFISRKRAVGWRARFTTAFENNHRYVFGHDGAPADGRNFLTFST